MEYLTPEQEVDKICHFSEPPLGGVVTSQTWRVLYNGQRRRANHYRFVTVILSILLILFALSLRAFNTELDAAATHMALAKDAISAQTSLILKQRQVISNCAGTLLQREALRQQVIDGVRLGAEVSQ